MLETKNLCKSYKPKKGVPVMAIKDVSLRFPEHGMVFLLGKSGSGKSTLLNLLGGLDRYDSGEILIKGVSSKAFDQQHFDSYRNTYVGFIFQEYNVLDEFSVGANIALALELQGRRAEDGEINRILEEVDLAGYGARKPNELSGGQKQRVAIARALVKNPEIIMADEPTGALDSVTGRQVLDTLKKLSADKLVIVVSHDREFAERYADRIIELADGEVIRDVEYLEPEDAGREDAPALAYDGDTVTVPGGYHLTEEDRLAINAYIDALGRGELELKLGPAAPARRATPTDVSRLAARTGESFRLIKSKLPMKSAFKIGVNSLGHKKLRLAITIILSCISFGLFGLADTFAAYDHVRACTDSLIDSGVSYASVEKARRRESGADVWWQTYGKIRPDELDKIADGSGVSMNGVYEPFGWDMSLTGNFDTSAEFTKTQYNIYASQLVGLTEMTAGRLEELGFSLMAGRLPDGSRDEIAISRYVCETFIIGGYTDGTEGAKYQKITAPEQMVGKTLELGGRTFTVTGVVDTHFDLERYKPLTEEKEYLSTAEELVQYALFNELASYRYSFNTVALVGEGYLSRVMAEDPTVQMMGDSGWIYFYSDIPDEDGWVDVDAGYIGTLGDVPADSIVWLDGERTELGEKELVVSLDCITIQGDGGFLQPSSEDIEEIKAYFPALKLRGDKYIYFAEGDNEELEGYTVVGVITDYPDIMLANESLLEGITIKDDGIYSFAVGVMPRTRAQVERLVSYCYRDDQEIRYPLQNAVTYELDTVNETVGILARVFLYVGLGFALFAALMLANFISTSIAYKKQEIGILRAIGSRSNDVFRIFFAESFVIAMINFVLAFIGVGAIVAVINHYIRRELGVLITILHFGVRQGALLLGVSLLVAALASFFPVRHIASKRPIDAIRNR